MNIKGIKKKSALKFLKKNLGTKGKNQISALNKINKIAILAEVELFKTYDFSRKLSDNFQVDKRNFDIFLYENDFGQGSLDQYESFSEKDFGLYGKLKSENVKKIVSDEYDLLIDYCNYDNIYSKVICFASTAKLIAGFKNEDFDIYDISIKLETNRIDTFNEELTKYLKILNLFK